MTTTAPEDRGDVQEPRRLLELLVGQGAVRGAEVHGPGRDLLDAAAAADGLVVEPRLRVTLAYSSNHLE